MGTCCQGQQNPSLQLRDPMIRFDVERRMPLKGTLVYREAEYSFDTEPRSERGVTSLLLNDVQLELDDEGQVLYVWGLCPHTSWVETDVNGPPAQPGVLRAVGIELTPGASLRINDQARWSVTVNRRSGWICLGDPSIITGECIYFAPGSKAALLKGEIKALWLNPKGITQG